MKTLVTFILTLIMSFSSTSMLWTSVDLKRDKSIETPVAYIENDCYIPYKDRNNSTDEIKTSALAFDTVSGFEKVTKTITVKTTATGDRALGNYVASAPIANALVRIDGVPRFTDENGRITAPLLRRYVELYVERAGYNPYIEIIEATEEEKTVYLKKPEDDIEIYSAMFDYQGNIFNLMQQPCYILQGDGSAFCTLTAECNVEIEKIMFYVNDELIKVDFGNELYFTYDDFNSYSNDDVFSIKVEYEGISSRKVDVNLKFNQMDLESMKSKLLGDLVRSTQAEKAAAERAAKNQDVPPLIIGNEASGTGAITEIEVDEKKWWQVLLDIFIPNGISLFDILQVDTPFQMSIVPDFYGGTIEWVFGVEVDLKEKFKEAKDWAQRRKLSGEEYEKALAYSQDYKQQLIDAQSKIDDINNRLKSIDEKEARYWQLMRDRNLYEGIMNDAHAIAQETGWWSQYNAAKKDFKAVDKAYNEVKRDIEKNGAQDIEFVNNAAKSLQQAQKNTYKALIEYLKDVKGYKQKISETIDLLKKGASGSGGFGFKLDFALMGSLKISYVKGAVESFSTYAELLFKPSYTIPFNIGPVPMFIRFELTVGVKFQTYFVNKFMPVSFAEAFRSISIILEFGMRMDLAAGLAGIASAGVYGKANFEWYLNPDKYLQFKWGIGIKLQFLLLELEFGYDPPEIKWPKEQKELTTNYSLLARSMAAGEDISADQLFDRIYQGSRPQIIKLADGRQMLIWIEDDIARDTYNRSVLKYSICDGGQWRAPKAVFDDGKGDFDFDVCVKDGEVYIAMQKANKVLTQESSNEDMIRSAEIYAAKYDYAKDAFVDIARITDNDSYDALPQFAVADGSSDVTLLWQSNTADDCLGLTGDNIIYSSRYDGRSWSKGVERFVGGRMIYSYTAAVENGELSIAVCEDKDGDILTADAYTVVAKEGKKVYEYDGILNPRYIKLSSGISLSYYKEGDIVVSDNYSDRTVIASGIASQEFNISKDESTPTIFYEAYDGEAEQGYCVLNVDGNWTSAFPVIDGAVPDTDISSLNGYYEDGIIYSAYNFRRVDDENFADTPLVLCVSSHERGYKIHTEALASDGISDGKSANIRLYVENIGDCDITRLSVEVCAQKIDLECSRALAVGEGRFFDIPFVAKIDQDGCIDVVTSVKDEDGVAVATDRFSMFVNYTDIELGAEMSVVNGKQQFKVVLRNASDVDTPLTLGIYINGELYSSRSIFLTAGEEVELKIEFDEINIDDYVYFAADAEVKEFDTYDNGAGIYSVQTETIPEERVENIYRQQLREIKKLMR